MTGKLKNSVHRHFDYDENGKYSSCKECGKKLKGKHPTNLMNHLRLKHEKIYDTVLNINKVEKNENKSKYAIKQDHEKEAKRNKLLECCIKLIAIHGRPFELLEDEAFRDIKALISPDFFEEGNSKKIKKMIENKAYEIKDKIAAEIKHKLISIKMDSATCMDRMFIGINAQYVKNSKIIVRNLTVSEIFYSQTAENLKSKLLDVLSDFQINISNIYSVTTDNGANYMKVSRLLNQEIEHRTIDEENDTDDDEEEENDAVDFESGLDDFNVSALNENENPFEIRSLACAAHTLQLCVKDALKGHECLFDKCRAVVRNLRRPLMKLKIKAQKLKKPILDCTTRWSSTFYMIERLIHLKSICDESVDICEIFDENCWININNIYECLTPCEEATKRLQKEQLTIGDFFTVWTICKTKIEKIYLPLAQNLVDAINKREKALLASKGFLVGIFMDPRLKVILSEEEQNNAKCFIKDMHQHLERIKAKDVRVADPDNAANPENQNRVRPGSSHEQMVPSSNSYKSDLQYLDSILDETERVRGPRRVILDLDYYLAEYLSAPRLATSENALQYWSSKESNMLTELALIALAAPATQVTVERLFSTLKFILAPSRNRLLDQTLHNIILIKSNEDLFTA